jgi:hypothetical protein
LLWNSIWDWAPLTDDAIVVRGGDMNDRNLWLNAHSVFRETGGADKGGVWGVCVGAADGHSVETIAKAMPYNGEVVRV